jgi:hypothetical protein
LLTESFKIGTVYFTHIGFPLTSETKTDVVKDYTELEGKFIVALKQGSVIMIVKVVEAF